MTQQPKNVQPVKQEKFEVKYDRWRNSLLDMSKKNKMLFFNQNKQIEIIFPSMTQLFEQLVIKQAKFDFPIVFEPTNLEKSSPMETDEEFQVRVKDAQQNAIRDRIQKSTEAMLKKPEIITQMSDKLLEKHIKMLRMKAKSTLEEQGVNTLYIAFGLIKWIEDQRTHDTVYSPIFFVPINIYRKKILDNFHMEILDDEVLVNPSLTEKFKSAFNIDLPAFPTEYDINIFTQQFEQIKELISKIPNWEVMERSTIGLFSFAKLGMFQDLVTYRDKVINHRIIKAIAEGSGYQEDPANIPNETDFADSADPMESFHIMDCDSSQFKAITYAKKGASMVIRGPPGTGKSQAISNIIAECLSIGKKVLFVAEKRAALDVVKKRLDKCGIGEFCLELHSQSANKLDVLKQINRSLQVELDKKTFRKAKYNNLRTQRLRLNEYIENLHTPVGKGDEGSTIYSKIGDYQKFDEIPLVEADIHRPLELLDENIFNIEDALGQLDVFKHVLQNYDFNPWAKIQFPYYEDGMKDDLYDRLNGLIEYSRKIMMEIEEIERKYNLASINDHASVESYRKFFINYSYKALDLNPTEMQQATGLFKALNSAYRNAKNNLMKSIRSGEKLSPEQHAVRILDFQKKYLNSPKIPTYQGIEASFDPVFDKDQKLEEFKEGLKPLLMNQGYYEDQDSSEWMKNSRIAEEWLPQLKDFNDWCSVQVILQKLKENAAEDFFQKIIGQPIIDLDVPLFDVFQKSYASCWIRAAMRKFSNLSSFNVDYHNRIRQNFLSLDDECIKINSYRLAERLFEDRPKNLMMNMGVKSSEYGILLREMAKKRNIRPLRTLIPQTKNFITKIKPCWMMSPLSVSQYLPASDFIEFFDVVIFDEASQVTPEDAVGAILRGKQLIVVGDEKQLPPTSFFATQLETSDSFETDMEIDEFASILEECTGVGLPVVMLNYHYRSKKEGLIAFSNYHFYENNLVTFPDTLRSGSGKEDAMDVDDLPAIEYNKVEGVYDFGKTRKNRIEADVVAEHIIEHYKNNEKNGTKFSLGVIAFSQAQQEQILTSLEKLYKEDPQLEVLVGSYSDEPLFIKNLENVQGDERDFIFFSIGYGKDKDGKMSINFGPMNKPGGERRLNVAITRGRYHVKVFCSFLPVELNTEKTKSSGIKLLAEYLDFANTGMFTQTGAEKALEAVTSTSLEDSVQKALEQRGYKVDRKIGRSRFQIDLAILNPDDPSKYLLAIECDGGSYANTKQARDRDRTRPQVLGLLGWSTFHVWAPEWFEDKEKVLDRIDKTIKDIKKGVKSKEQIEEESKPEDVKVQFTVKEEGEGAVPANGNGNGVSTISNGEEAASGAAPSNGTAKKSSGGKGVSELKQKFLELPGVKEYTAYTIVNTETPETFNRVQSRMKIANDIINTEGPIHHELLEKRMKDYFALKHAGKQQKEKIDEVLEAIPHTDDYFFPKKMTDNLIRVEMGKSSARPFDQIYPIELKNALKIMVQQAISIDKDELYLRICQLFGFTSRRPEYIAILDRLVAELITNATVPADAIRGFDINAVPVESITAKVPSGASIPEESTQIPGEGDSTVESSEAGSTSSEEINMDEVMASVNEVLKDKPSDSGAPSITTHDILDVLSNGKYYNFGDFINELDVVDERGITEINNAIKELKSKKIIEEMQKQGETYWRIKV